MKSIASPRKPAKSEKYRWVNYHGKPVRGLWRRGDRFYARLTIEEAEGRKQVTWLVREGASTIPQGVEALNAKKVERSKNTLKAKPFAPRLCDYLKTHRERPKHSGKKAGFVVTGTGHLMSEKLEAHRRSKWPHSALHRLTASELSE